MCKNHKLFGKHLNRKQECSRNLYIMRLKKKVKAIKTETDKEKIKKNGKVK